MASLYIVINSHLFPSLSQRVVGRRAAVQATEVKDGEEGGAGGGSAGYGQHTGRSGGAGRQTEPGPVTIRGNRPPDGSVDRQEAREAQGDRPVYHSLTRLYEGAQVAVVVIIDIGGT